MTDGPKILKWRKQKLYRCRLCAYDSLDRKQFEDHFAKAHPPLRVIVGGKTDEVPDEPVTEPDAETGKEK